VPFDKREAWTGSYIEQPDLQVRMEAAAFQGRLVAFQAFGPWNPAATASALGLPPRPAGPGAAAVVSLAFLATAVALAWANARAGRGDRRGAFRLAVFTGVLQLLVSALTIHHVTGTGEGILFLMTVNQALSEAAAAYVFYLALEPYVRRHWPQLLVSWSRVLAGHWRDALVGRDVVVGVALAALAHLTLVIHLWLVAGSHQSKDLDAVLSVRRVAGLFAGQFGSAIRSALFACFFLMLARTLVRRTWLAGAVMALLLTAAAIPGAPSWAIGARDGAIIVIPFVVALGRFGLVSAATYFFVRTILNFGPTTLQASAWYAGVSFFNLGTIAAIAVWACLTSMGRIAGSTRANR
jgi:serine/threonine-protein kinase